MNLCSAGWRGTVHLQKKQEADAFSVPACLHYTEIRTEQAFQVLLFLSSANMTSEGENRVID